MPTELMSYDCMSSSTWAAVAGLCEPLIMNGCGVIARDDEASRKLHCCCCCCCGDAAPGTAFVTAAACLVAWLHVYIHQQPLWRQNNKMYL